MKSPIQAYSIAVGDFYIGLAARCLAISRFFNPELPLTLYFANSEMTSTLLTQLKEHENIRIEEFEIEDPSDRWAINFAKWEVDLSVLGEPDNYLYLDADAFIIGSLPSVIPLVKPVGVCQHPNAKTLTKKHAEGNITRTHWSMNGPASYFVPFEHRTNYINAGVGLFSFEGMNHFREQLHIMRLRDEELGYWQTSPYYDEAYVNKYCLVNFPDRVQILPSVWNQFHTLGPSWRFGICHLVGFGAGWGLNWLMNRADYVLRKFNVPDPIQRFFNSFRAAQFHDLVNFDPPSDSAYEIKE